VLLPVKGLSYAKARCAMSADAMKAITMRRFLRSTGWAEGCRFAVYNTANPDKCYTQKPSMTLRTLPVVLCSKRVIRAANIQSVKVPRRIECHAGTSICPGHKGTRDKGKRQSGLEEHGGGRISCCDTRDGMAVSSTRTQGSKKRKKQVMKLRGGVCIYVIQVCKRQRNYINAIVINATTNS
jgi:hypothetical protein